MKSSGAPLLFTKQTTKITLRTLPFTKNQSTQEVQKINYCKVYLGYALLRLIVSFAG
jgi:hypothetical protein